MQSTASSSCCPGPLVANARRNLLFPGTTNPTVVLRRASLRGVSPCKGATSPVITPRVVSNGQELLEMHQRENCNAERSPIFMQRVVHATPETRGTQRENSNRPTSPLVNRNKFQTAPEFTGKHQSESSTPQRSPHPVHNWQEQVEKHLCDCRSLIEDVRIDCATRFSSLEASLQSRLSALESSTQIRNQESGIDYSKISTLEASLQSRIHAVDSLNFRISNLEANMNLTAQAVDDTKSSTFNFKSRLDTAMQILEEIESQVTYMFPELQKNSRVCSDIQHEVSALGYKLIRLQKADVSRHFNNMEPPADDAHEKHKQCNTYASTNLDEVLEAETGSTATEPPDSMMHSHLDQDLSDENTVVGDVDEIRLTSGMKATGGATNQPSNTYAGVPMQDGFHDAECGTLFAQAREDNPKQ